MAKKTEGGAWINVNGNDKKGHVNVYNNDPQNDHDSIHINIDYEKGTFNITEKTDGVKTETQCNCYLTTACMKHHLEEFDDNCYELFMLRWFRDNFVSKREIKHYYEVAPTIVENIDNSIECDEIYNYIYENVISVCVDAIKHGDFEFAYNRYKNSILALEEECMTDIPYKGMDKVLSKTALSLR